jgi:hypothetical protein
LPAPGRADTIAGMTTKLKVTPKSKPAAKKAAGGSVSAIYALHDPCTGEIRYIGKANDPDARLKSHMRDSLRRNTPVYCWIKKLLDAQSRPVMRVMEWTSDWQEAEKRLIAEYRIAGARLLNLADGGNEPACSRHVRASNGVKVARGRDKDVWALTRRMGELLRWLQTNGRIEKAEQMMMTINLFGLMSATEKKRMAIACSGRLESINDSI